MPIAKRHIVDFTPTEHSSAADKLKFYRHFIHFMKCGCKETMFPGWFYSRLSMTFGHIAHYNRNGFYHTWFTSAAKKAAFIEHCLRWPCHGWPSHSYCDVERALQIWLASSGLHAKWMAEDAALIESAERATLARLQNKYGAT